MHMFGVYQSEVQSFLQYQEVGFQSLLKHLLHSDVSLKQCVMQFYKKSTTPAGLLTITAFFVVASVLTTILSNLTKTKVFLITCVCKFACCSRTDTVKDGFIFQIRTSRRQTCGNRSFFISYSLSWFHPVSDNFSCNHWYNLYILERWPMWRRFL